MDCVIVAGGQPKPGESLFQITQGNLKAALEINGRPMIAWVIDALKEAVSIDRIAIVGIDLLELHDSTIYLLPDQDNIIDNVLAGIHWHLERNSDFDALMICSSDIPAITGPIVDDFVDDCAPFDRAVYFPVVTQEEMRSRFPGSNRTYSKFKDVTVAGGDLVIIRPGLVDLDRNFWQDIFDARKYPWRIAKKTGWKSLLEFVLGQMTLARAEEIGQKIIGHPVKVITARHPELAMDVDQVSHLDVLLTELR